ncbi:hypothetical protein ACJMK2_007946 [Sinanodonta woodiana]|uniref:MARVEL domain-containing protein n=1 Tax=Sinanodonta woodiana TaxID=1069815 RepID=A0ABD3VK19_SINWO
MWGHHATCLFFVSLLFTLMLLIPQIYILAMKKSSRFCAGHLFELLIVSIIITFFVIGFSFLFSIMIPVPRQIKLAFHIFGMVDLIESLVLLGFFLHSEDCKSSTPELYWISATLTWFSVASMIFFALLLPFWILNEVKKNSVLDPYSRTGICYEPVSCCSCLWHI